MKEIAEFIRLMEKYPPTPMGVKPQNFDSAIAKALLALCKREQARG